ncbi:hypothetical protein B0T22DRAFT_495010 [Podospora appendiculata]|uniref:Uncharacterized protein n=1 Tax=Podospora appendiculata TaxID=314037 RepID=A0AAE0WYV9_9PEZI|nr:hypothetical protein B0T22DRAFT_495010 [Podospora appendiculata]
MKRPAAWAALKLLARVPVSFAAETDARRSADVQAFFNAHQNDTAAFSTEIAPPRVPSPSSRGTINILWSCIVTLVACVYTALHLNIPASNERGTARLLLRKIKWVLVSLIAPEIVLYVALMQFIEARSLMRSSRELVKRKKTKGDTSAANDMINMNYCFFVVMGGLQFSIDDIYPSEHIEDRSKANTIQKALVLTQVGWMALQCIVKKAQGFPISLLEIHTFFHVVCAVALYTLWVEKPLDIREPEIITVTAAFEDVLALMVQEQYCILQNASAVLFPPRTAENESHVFAAKLSDKMVTMRLDQEQNPVPVIWKDQASVLGDGEVLPCGFGYLRQLSDEELKKYKNWNGYHIRLEASDILRAERAVKHIQVLDGPIIHHVNTGRPYGTEGHEIFGNLYIYPGGKYRTAFSSGGHFTHHADKSHVHFMYDVALRSHESYLHRVTQFCTDLVATFAFASYLHFIVVALLPALYGGIHLSAWNSVFPSHIESILWKASGLIIVVTIPMLWIALLVTLLPTNVILLAADMYAGSQNEKVEIYFGIVIAVIQLYVFLSMVVYVCARAFIIVVAFLSTRCMPYGVYYIPSWLQIFPHL